MATHDFRPLYACYPSIIAQMPDTFTSHQFILELARQNQALYIEALYSYRHHTYRNACAPFMMVHGVLAQHLAAYPGLIEQTSRGVPSVDIFGQVVGATAWRKTKRAY